MQTMKPTAPSMFGTCVLVFSLIGAQALVLREDGAGQVQIPSESGWSFCAAQWGECRCSGMVRWGNKDTWRYVQPKSDGSVNVVACSVDQFGDVLPGDGDKHCQCKGTVDPMAVEEQGVRLASPKKQKLLGDAYWLALGHSEVAKLHVKGSTQWAEATLYARNVDKEFVEKTKQILQEQGIGGRELLRLKMEDLMHDGVPRGPAMELVESIQSLNSLSSGWFFCAKQWNECRCQGRVAWGNKDRWKIIDPPSDGSVLTVMCSVDRLQDVLPGDNGKHCQCQGTVNPESSTAQAVSLLERGTANSSKKLAAIVTSSKANETTESEWTFCSAQWQECECASTMRWGKGTIWKTFEAPREGSSYTKKCTIDALGDPIPGEDGKRCECLVKHGSSFERQLNPMLLSVSLAEKLGAPLVSSCEIFEAGRDTEAGRMQWQAVEPFCSESWEKDAQNQEALKAGPRSMSLVSRRKLLEARLDPRFAANYNSLVRKDGWVPKAFVNYYAGSPGSKHFKMTEQLIRSVHMFSKELIFVYHFGSRVPDDWTPERFPRLVVMHAAPIEPDAHRSFNFNKIRAFLMSRALTGVQLDSDQFVAPGVDYMFTMTEREITNTTPLPVLPVHFFSFTQKETPTNIWWKRFCPDPPACKAHSMRWSHAHPTWTFWSLPFYGRWLRRHFRDETLPATTDGSVSLGALRVSSIPEDEDVLNVATWEEKGRKQWCKYDNDYMEFSELMHWSPSDGNNTIVGDIVSDWKFYPKGAAKSFFTAHNCKDPEATAKLLDKIEARWKSGTYPASTITYKHRIWHSGKELREAHPDLPCIF
eukprot:TRINITY_DN10441_c0_g2_i1.p1 TRINITY_DN10441_c0_g2~~TRINITY_DN10441_c0_g2_i1.p1  ORF type:complete len:815 (-),score=163.36 TRINITY_DN10441_c0_g2_i1:23-2467(-)